MNLKFDTSFPELVYLVKFSNDTSAVALREKLDYQFINYVRFASDIIHKSPGHYPCENFHTTTRTSLP